MPRRPRRWEPGAIYHVDSRAHDGEPIFARDEDREFLVARASRVFTEEGAVCFAWAVLVNHYHMLVRFPQHPGPVMHRLNTALGGRVRRRRGGAGAVFQGRYFGAMCEDEAGVLTRLAYVTANPIHHGIVESVDALLGYRWSSLGEVTGLREARLAHPASALALIHDRPDRAYEGLIDLLNTRVQIWAERDAVQSPPRDPDTDAPLDETIIPPHRNRERVAMPAGLTAIAGRASPGTRDWRAVVDRRDGLRALGWTPDALVGAACALIGSGADPDAVRAGNRRHAASRARAVVAHVACDHVAWPTNEVALALGVSHWAVVHARPKGAALLAAAGLEADQMLRRSLADRGKC